MPPNFMILMDDRRHIVPHPYTQENIILACEILGIPAHWRHRGRLPHIDAPARMQLELMDRTIPVRSRDIVRIIRGGYPFACYKCGEPALLGVRHGRKYYCVRHWPEVARAHAGQGATAPMAKLPGTSGE